MKSDNRDRPRNTPARLDDPDLWAKLLSSSHRGAKRRRTLESMLKLWGQDHGASAVAVYAPGTSGLQLVANAGERTVSQILTPGQRGDDSLQELELPGSYWVVHNSKSHTATPASADAIQLACAANIVQLEEKFDEQSFFAMSQGVEMMALYEVGLAIASILDLEPLVEELLSRALLLLDVRRGAVYQLEDDRYVLTRARGAAVAEFHASGVDLDSLSAGEPSGTSILPGVEHVMGVPIGQDSSHKGLLVVGSIEAREEGAFSAKDRRTLKLFANQAAIAIEKVRLHELALAKHRQDRELEIAAEIQRQLLPESMPHIEGFDVLGWNRSARAVGGDYFTFRSLGNDEWAVIIGDVSGKGSPAALLVSTIDSALRVLLDHNRVDGDLVQNLNHHVYEASTGNKYVTMVLASLDARRGEFSFVNAGHNDGLLLRADGHVEQLESTGPPVGLLPAAQYTQERVALREGDLVCLYSDGITECENLKEEEYGMKRLTDLLREHRERPLDELLNRLDEAVTEYSAGLPQGDDQTVILLRRRAV
jgi:sigma-B regulation protein RsbU (phosphoserine phosphatase)